LTRKELAHRVSCSIETIRKIESGERYPSTQIAKLLAEHLALDFDETFSNRQPARSPSLIEPEFPLIGRAAEWTTLRSTWHTALQGKAQLICIAGDAGIGKTRLAEELLIHAHRNGHSVARARAYALEGRLAYAPVADWLRCPALANAVSALPVVWRSEIARLLPELLIKDGTLPPPQPLTERWQLKRLFEALQQAFSAAEKQNPVLLVLDDMQWCDPETLEWLQYLLSAAPYHKLLVTGTVRDAEVDADHQLHKLWRNLLHEEQLTLLPLAPLSQTAVARLGAEVAQRPLDVKDAGQLFDECAGNPLFVIESVRFQDNLHNQQQTQTVHAFASQGNGLVPLSPKVYAVIQARLDKLSPTARAIADLAAVAGRAFTLPLLTQTGRWDETQVALGVDELLHRRLVREQDSTQLDFSHDRIRDVAYAEISPVKRNLLHRAVAQALESIHANRLDAVAGELAGHYQQADDLGRALIYFRQAAAVAERLYAHHEVVRYLEKAIAIAQMKLDNPEFSTAAIDLWQELGSARVWIHGYGSASQGEAWGKAHKLAMRGGTVFQRAQATILLASVASNRGELRLCFGHAQEALPLAKDSGDPYLIASANSLYGRALYHFGKLEQALTYLQRAIAHAEEHALTTDAAKKWRSFYYSLLTRVAKCLWLLGFSDQANDAAYKVVTNIHADIDVFDRFGPLDFTAQLYSFVRDFEAMRRLGESLIELSTKYEFSFFQWSGRIYYGWALAHLGDVRTGLDLVRAGIKAQREQGSHLFASYNRGLLAEVLALTGEHEEAIDEVDTGLVFANETGNMYWSAHLLKLKGDLLQALGAPDSETEAWYQHALALARAQCARSLELRAAMSLARLWQKQGNFAQAQHLLAPIYGWFTEGFDTPDLQEARALLASLDQSLGSTPTLAHSSRYPSIPSASATSSA
jgi:DNA-binding XRE family transcriptional regulator/tetratricopeptide (TPR) repeat protein